MLSRFILTPYFLDEEEPELEEVASSEWEINRPDLPQKDKMSRLVALNRPLADFVAETVRLGERPVSIAGDCTTSLGVMAGLQRANLQPTLIWFDAHGDFNTPATTPSGFLGGMPLAMLVGRGDQAMVNGLGLKPLPESRVILTDARDLDPEEEEALADSDVIHLPDVSGLLAHPLPDGPLYVHFDADVIDPAEAPAMNYLAEAGPSVMTLKLVMQRLVETGRVTAVSVSSWNPTMDEDGRSRQAVMELVEALIVD